MTVTDRYNDVAVYVGGCMRGSDMDTFHPIMMQAKSLCETHQFDAAKAKLDLAIQKAARSYANREHLERVLEVLMECAAWLSPGENLFLLTSWARAVEAAQKGKFEEASWHLLETEANRHGYWLQHQASQKEIQPLRAYGMQYPSHEARNPHLVRAEFLKLL